ncbi:MAG TPA: TrmH family RNA methyltransferase, partial [Pirellulaceae bacterium]
MAFPIHSPHNERLKRAIELRGHKGRVRQGRFLIDGLREATRALQSSLEIDEVFICPEVLQSGMAQRLVDLAAARCQRVYEIPEHLWKKLRYGDRPDGIILVGCDGPRHLTDARLNAVSLVVVIQGVEKPGNIGAIVRSADAAGASAVILADGTHDIYNPNT